MNVTRRTIFGYGYTAACERDENGNLGICKVKRPDYRGTLKTLQKAIDQDRTLQSFKSGGTYYRDAWFIRNGGKWHRVTDPWFGPKTDPLYDEYGREESVEIETE